MSGPGGDKREQRLVFGEDPELYDRARPGYPDALVDDVLAFSADSAASAASAASADSARAVGPASIRALEVGAGTGKATVAFAARGLEIVALEPDPAMGELASRNCRPYTGVRIVQAAFEDWPVEEGAFGLLFSAQAWHWVRPGLRCELAARHLERGGTVALFWHRTDWDPRDPLRLGLDESYRLQAPDLYEKGPGFPGLTPEALQTGAREELAASNAFSEVTAHHHRWRATFTPDSFLDLLATQSDHRLLPERQRAGLFHAVRELLVEHGGEVSVPYDTLLVLGRRVR